MSINYALTRNHLTNGSNQYRAMVQFNGSIDLEGVIDRMLARGSTITKADALAVLQNYYDTIEGLVLEGYRVVTPGANYGVSVRGNFSDITDSYNPKRHQVEAVVTPGNQLRQLIRERAQVHKDEAIIPQPSPLKYVDLDSNTFDSSLTPGGLGRLNGHRLKFDPADPQQGVFLAATDGTEHRVEQLAKHTRTELIFRLPAGLASGDYRLEVRAIFGLADLRRGALKATLSVS